jgi:hypothetical protein
MMTKPVESGRRRSRGPADVLGEDYRDPRGIPDAITPFRSTP